MAWFRGTLFAVLCGLLVAMHEISTLSLGFVTPQGTWSFAEMQGPASGSAREAWVATMAPDQVGSWQQLVVIFVVLDMLFVAAYTYALWGIGRHLPSPWKFAALALVATDGVENVMFWIAGAQRDGTVDPDLVTWLLRVTSFKWILVYLLAGTASLALLRHLPAVGSWVRAVWIQRFSLLAFLPVALLSVVPGPSVFDQLPDVQRSWLDADTFGGFVWVAARPALVHGLLLLPAIFALGRIRSDWVERRRQAQGAADGVAVEMPALEGTVGWCYRSLWLVGPITLVALAVLVTLSDTGDVVWRRLFAFILVPLVVFAGSVVIERGKTAGHLQSVHARAPRPVHDALPGRVRVVGDVMAVASVSLAGLGMVRSMTGLVVLNATDLIAASDVVARARILLLVGLVTAVVPWLVAPWVLAKIDQWSTGTGVTGWLGTLVTPGATPSGSLGPLPSYVVGRLVFLMVSVAAFVALAIGTVQVAGFLGALAVTMAALASVVVMLGVTVAFAQERQPVELFQLARMRSTPVLAPVLVALVLTGSLGGRGDVHGVQSDPEASTAAGDRPTMPMAFEDWLGQSGGCFFEVTVGGRVVRVRPMLMLAAEGGGIRAAYWTAAAVQRIAAAGQGGCGARSTFFSTGASGGALGLSVARFDASPLEGVSAVSDDKALAVGAASMLTRDTLATVGIRKHETTLHRDDRSSWVDRAGLMELSWQSANDPDARLIGDEGDYLQPRGDATDRPTATGQLILNSTAARTFCRSLVSQVAFTAATPGRNGYPECGTSGAGPNAFDLLGTYDCRPGPWALSGGLLASRFPYITPSGVEEACGDHTSAQIIDGGYVENDGLGTLGDLSPTWRGLVADHNSEALTSDSPEIVVPLVVYLDNGTGKGYSLAETPESGEDETSFTVQAREPRWFVTIPEPLVPPWGYVFRPSRPDTVAQLSRDDRLVRAQWCLAPGCASVVAAVAGRLPLRTFVVNQQEQPSIGAPLGWVLSQTSKNDLDGDLCLQARRTSTDLVAVDEVPDVGTLGDLFDALGGTPDLSDCPDH